MSTSKYPSDLRTFAVTVYLNVTTVAEAIASGDPSVDAVADAGRLDSDAVFLRWGLRGDGVGRIAHRAGDRLCRLGGWQVNATSAQAAADVAFAIGNADLGCEPILDAAIREYRSARVRSLSVGDVVVVETPDGAAAFAVAGWGFASVDLAEFVVEDGR